MNIMSIIGKVWKYGDDINTDVIFPGKYTYTVTDEKELAKHAMEDLDPDFANKVKEGDIIVAGTNFGCGSSREQAATCLKASGISAIIAKSFSRIFFRNAVNNGLPLIQCPECINEINKDDIIEIDFEKGIVKKNTEPSTTFSFPPLPLSVLEILQEGGLIPYLKKKYKSN